MNDNIITEIVYGDQVLYTLTKSVRAYCETAYKNASNNSKLITLLANMLRYGAMSQVYVNYRTDALADVGWESRCTPYALPDGKPANTGHLYNEYDKNNAYVSGSAVIIDYVNYLSFMSNLLMQVIFSTSLRIGFNKYILVFIITQLHKPIHGFFTYLERIIILRV